MRLLFIKNRLRKINGNTVIPVNNNSDNNMIPINNNSNMIPIDHVFQLYNNNNFYNSEQLDQSKARLSQMKLNGDNFSDINNDTKNALMNTIAYYNSQ